MRPISEDLRRRIVAAREAGAGAVEVSKRFSVHRRTVSRLYAQYERSGSVQPKRIGGYRQSRLATYGPALEGWIAQQADLTLAELQGRCRKELKVQIGLNALWHQLRKLGLSVKKNDARRGARPARRGRGAGPVARGAAVLGSKTSGVHR